MEIKKYTKELMEDCLEFEQNLCKEENFWRWKIDEAYIASVKASFDDSRFYNSLSLLAYDGDSVVGRDRLYAHMQSF